MGGEKPRDLLDSKLPSCLQDDETRSITLMMVLVKTQVLKTPACSSSVTDEID
jgi:hypothetical protein